MQYSAYVENGEMKFFDVQGKEVGWDEIMKYNKSTAFNPDSRRPQVKSRQKSKKIKPQQIKIKPNQPHAQLPDTPQDLQSIPAVPAKMLFSDFIPEYLLMQKYQLRQNTYEIYKITAETHVIPYFQKLNLSIQELTTLHIQHYFHVKMDEGLAASTLKKHFTIINGALSYAMHNMQMILHNPADRVKRFRVEKRKFTCYNVEQVKDLLLEVKDHPLEAMIILSSHYGLRRSEVLALRWGAIDFTANTITIKRTVVRTSLSSIDQEKNKSSDSYRTMPLMDDVKKYLQKLYIHQKNMKLIYKDDYIDNDLICKKDDGKPFRPDYVSKCFSQIVNRSNKLPAVRLHDLRHLRHSAASIFFNEGYDILLISYWLGHADVNTTKRYIHIEYLSKLEMSQHMNDAIGLAKLYGLDDDIDDEFRRHYIGTTPGK